MRTQKAVSQQEQTLHHSFHCTRPIIKVYLSQPHPELAAMDLISLSGEAIQSYKSWLECESPVSLTEGSLSQLHCPALRTKLFSPKQLLAASM